MSAIGKQSDQFLAVGQVVRIEIGRIDDHFLFEAGAVVLHEAAQAQGRVEPLGTDRLVIVDDRVARGGAGERRLCDGPTGEGIEQRRFADAGAAHEHDDEERLIDGKGFGLASEIVGAPFELGALEHG